MKKYILFYLILLPFLVLSQNQGKIWYFGNKAGIDFNTNPPTALLNGQLTTNEGCASIADANGQLLFYTDGIKVWNSNHTLMSNANGSVSLGGNPSSSQSGVIVPDPSSTNKFYIFSVSAYQASNVYYSSVDMTLNGGLGDVDSSVRTVPLLSGTGEYIQSVLSGDGTFYWVVMHKANSNSYYSYKVTATGVNTVPVISSVGSTVSSSGDIGYIKFNSAGTKIIRTGYISNVFDLSDFNTTTGVVSNPITINYPGAYGAEFSPNGNLLYVSAVGGSSGTSQFNLQASDIAASKLTLGSAQGAMQSAPDGKIYIAGAGTSLSVISDPNVLGASCNFALKSFSLGGKSSTYGLPNIISSFVSTGPPVLASLTSSNIATTTATIGATVSTDGGEAITSRGFYYGTSANPSTNLTTVTGTTGAMSADLTGLQPGTLYYFRAFATNSNGTTTLGDGTFTALSGPSFVCAEIQNRNNGNNAGVCAGVGSNPIASNFTNTAFAVIPSTAKTGNITFKWATGTEPQDPLAISNVWINGVSTSTQVGPASPYSISGQNTLVTYCFYGINLPSSGNYTLEFKDPQTNTVIGRCTFSGSSNVATTEPTLTTNAAPVVTGPSSNTSATATLSMYEGLTAVYNYTANETVTWSITGGVDQALFTIDPTTGALIFNTAPVFGENNMYEVTVTATDEQGATASQTLTITILNDLDPIITAITNITACVDQSILNVSFTISDDITTADNLVITAVSNNQNIVADNAINISGTGGTKNISFTPVTGASGTVTITLSVTDELNQTSTTTFDVVFENPILSVNQTQYLLPLNVPITPITINNSGAIIQTSGGFVDETGDGSEKGFDDFPFTFNGITVDKVLTGNATVYPSAYVSCNTTTKARSIYIGQSSAATFKTTFTKPVNNLQYRITGANVGEIITVTTSHGTPIITVVENCNTSVNSNVITFGNGTSSAGGIIKVISTESFEWINFSHNGGQGGCLFTLDFETIQTGNIASAGSWTISPNLPQGLIFNSSNGEITGTPTEAILPKDFTITGTTGFGCSDSIVLNISTNSDPTISTISNQTACPTAEVVVEATIADNETISDNLILTATSSNQNLVDAINISTTGNIRTISILPVQNNQGTSTITLTVKDEFGAQAQTTFDVTFIDVTPPTALAKDITIQLDENGVAAILTSQIDNGSSDECEIESMSVSPNTFNGTNLANGGLNNVVLTVEDKGGNIATANAVVTIEDLIFPVITSTDSPNDPSVDNYACDSVHNFVAGPSSCVALVSIAKPIWSDNVGIVSRTQSANNNVALTNLGDIVLGNFPVGTTIVTFTATDSSGNTTSCNVTIVVTDTQFPVITNCPTDITVTNQTGSCSRLVNLITPTAGDNCTVSSVTYQTSGATILNGNDFPNVLTLNVGITNIVYTVSDASGNTIQCSYNVTVNDTEKPVVSGTPSNITQSNDAGLNGAVVTWTAPTAADNCSVATFVSSHQPGDFFPVGTTTVAYTATDIHGNVITSSFTVTINDTEKPVISGTPSNITQSNDAGICGAVVTWTAPTATDNSGIATFVSSHQSGDVFPEGTTTVTYTATDIHGNVLTSSFTVTINDTEKPVVIALPLITSVDYISNSNQCGASVFWTEPVVTDNCSISIINQTHRSGDFFQEGETTVTYTIRDIHDNETLISVVVFVDPANLDCDGDGVTNARENIDGTDKQDLCSSIPTSITMDVRNDYLDADCDGDGLSNREEIGPDQTKPIDSDGDGIADYLEFNKHSTSTDDLEIFNLVTPNNDGDNDVFVIRNIELYPENSIEIYNRWGVKVYDVSGYGQNGRFFTGLSEGRVTIGKSSLLPTGTYFYIVKYKASNGAWKDRKGYLYLTR